MRLEFEAKYWAGAEGIEPPVAVLETAGLPLTDAPKGTYKSKKKA